MHLHCGSVIYMKCAIRLNVYSPKVVVFIVKFYLIYKKKKINCLSLFADYFTVLVISHVLSVYQNVFRKMECESGN